MEEVEQVLGVQAAPINWPVGYGKEFCGVTDCATKEVILFSRSELGGAAKAEVEKISL